MCSNYSYTVCMALYPWLSLLNSSERNALISVPKLLLSQKKKNKFPLKNTSVDDDGKSENFVTFIEISITKTELW
jgi:hypothetical protein